MNAQQIKEIVEEELRRFDASSIEGNNYPDRPFRVAVSRNFNGGDYPYGSHTEIREYGDTTVGYAYSREEARRLLYEAAYEAELQNTGYQHQKEIEGLQQDLDDVLDELAEGEGHQLITHVTKVKQTKKRR